MNVFAYYWMHAVNLCSLCESVMESHKFHMPKYAKESKNEIDQQITHKDKVLVY